LQAVDDKSRAAKLVVLGWAVEIDDLVTGVIVSRKQETGKTRDAWEKLVQGIIAEEVLRQSRM